MIVIPGPASRELGNKIAGLLKKRALPVEFKQFPDGEAYIRFDGDVEDEEVAIVQTTSPPQNENLINLFLMVDNAKDLMAKRITAVVPYLAYMRQDKRFRPGEAFSVKTIVTLLEACGVHQIITVNSHNPRILRTLRARVEDLSAVGLLAEHFREQGFDGAFSLSLGKKAESVAAEANEILKGGCGYVETRRDRLTGKVTIEKKTLPVRNRDVIVFDDIISSGSTMARAIGQVRTQGAHRVYAACVHPLLVGDARGKIMESGADGIVGTDCVPSPVSLVSVAPLIAGVLTEEEPTL